MFSRDYRGRLAPRKTTLALTISRFRPLAALPKVAMMLSLPPFLGYLETKGA